MGKNIGIDIGYGFVKITDGTEKYSFPSVVGLAEELSYRSGGLVPPPKVKNLAVTLEGKSYFVGDLAVRQSGIAFRSLNQKRVESVDLKVLFLTGLSLFTEGKGQSFNVVTGLPPGHFHYESALIQLLTGEHRITVPNGGGEPVEKVIKVERVKVLPQPIGTFYAAVLDDKGQTRDQKLASARVGILDVGFRTTDLVVADGGEYIDRAARSINMGLSNAYAIIAERLRKELDVQKETYALDETVNNSEVRVAGRVHDISGVKNFAFESISTKIVAEVNSLWDTRELDFILVTGGGGKALAGFLVRKFENAALVDGAEMANVRGYMNWAQRVFHPAGPGFVDGQKPSPAAAS